ncbi:MFS transporter [Labrys monachus]|uniref:MFS family arabinose efflux permease n=1 Tax=Labrys monachus TaxID=217067 RepID=A0ABU0FG03_9HYPH|nr:MFS transporter [Labrys monachus]MDQ0393538.1 putative MFS family arabinose efflux permease [Labrys monachus]
MTEATDTSTATPMFEHTDTDWQSVGILWGIGIGAAMQFAKFSAAFTELQSHYDVDATQIGLALSIVGFVGLVLGVSAGVLAGRTGYRRVLVGCLIVGASLSLLQSFLPPFPVLLFSRFAEGVSHLGIVVAAPTMMAFVSARRHRSITMAIWGTFFGVAFGLMGWIGPLVIKHSGLPSLFVGHAAFMAIFALCALRLPATKQAAMRSVEQATFGHFFKENLAVYRNPRTVLPGAIFLFHTSMYIALLTFVPRLTTHPDVTSLLLVALPLASTGGTFLAGIIAQYLMSPQTLVVIAYMVVAGLSVAVATTVSSDYVFVCAAMSLLLFSGLVQGATFATIPHVTRSPDEQAQANGAIAQLGNLGSTLGPPVFAMALGKYGSTGIIGLTFFLCLGGVAVGWMAQKLR